MIVQIRAQKLAYANLLNELKAERASHQQTMTKLDGSASEADQLRKLSAALQVKVDRLAKEKVDMKRQLTVDMHLKRLKPAWMPFCSNRSLVLVRHPAPETRLLKRHKTSNSSAPIMNFKQTSFGYFTAILLLTMSGCQLQNCNPFARFLANKLCLTPPSRATYKFFETGKPSLFVRAVSFWWLLVGAMEIIRLNERFCGN